MAFAPGVRCVRGLGGKGQRGGFQGGKTTRPRRRESGKGGRTLARDGACWDAARAGRLHSDLAESGAVE